MTILLRGGRKTAHLTKESCNEEEKTRQNRAAGPQGGPPQKRPPPEAN